MKNSGHSIQLLEPANIRSLSTIVRFRVFSLFTKVSTDEALKGIRNKFHNDHMLGELPILQIEAIMKIIFTC